MDFSPENRKQEDSELVLKIKNYQSKFMYLSKLFFENKRKIKNWHHQPICSAEDTERRSSERRKMINVRNLNLYKERKALKKEYIQVKYLSILYFI